MLRVCGKRQTPERPFISSVDPGRTASSRVASLLEVSARSLQLGRTATSECLQCLLLFLPTATTFLSIIALALITTTWANIPIDDRILNLFNHIQRPLLPYPQSLAARIRSFATPSSKPPATTVDPPNAVRHQTQWSSRPGSSGNASRSVQDPSTFEKS